MKRIIDIHLSNWAGSKTRKSLLLRGARQVGKTFAVRTLGSSFESHHDTPYGIRFSTHNYSVHNKIISYPLYAVALGIQWENNNF